MDAPSLFDHVLAIAFAVALPLRGYLSFPKVRARLAEDRPGTRLRLYRRTMAWQWTAAAIVVGSWHLQGRPLSELGWAWPGHVGTFVALGVVVLVIGFMSWQLIGLPRHPDIHAPVREQLEKAAPFLPRNADESAWFFGTAVTAGICEELMFRSFLIAYAASFVGPWGAVLVTALAFGIGHAYQGRTGALKTFIAGLVGGALYVVGGTILLPMLLHAFVDVHGGMVYRIVRR